MEVDDGPRRRHGFRLEELGSAQTYPTDPLGGRRVID